MKTTRPSLGFLVFFTVIAFALAMVAPSGAMATGTRGATFERSPNYLAPRPSTFASIKKPLGMAVTTDRILVTQFNTDTVRSLDSAGTVTTFATLPSTGNKFLERYIAISSGLGGFRPGYIYVTVGQNTYKITPDGSTVTLFVNIPSMPNGETGITFDTVGTFGYKMILTDRRGPVWLVDSTGAATKFFDVGKQIEGPLVAPQSFVPFGGQLLLSNEYIDTIFALKSDGTLSKLPGTWDSPEGAVGIPTRACNFGTSRGAYFVAMEDLNLVVKFPASMFTGLGGDVLTPSELHDPSLYIGRWHSNGNSVTLSTFWGPDSRYTPQLEGSAFAPCPGGPEG